jgi:hypothetical protein
MAQLAALLKPRTALAALVKDFTQSASPTSGITAYGNTGRKKRKRVRLRAGASLLRLVKAFDPDQERDEHGRWSAAGGAGGAQTSSERMGQDTLSMEPSDVLPGLLLQQAHDAIARYGQPGADDEARSLTEGQKDAARHELAPSVAAANAAKPAFDDTVRGIAEAVGGRASLAPIKGGERLLEKHVFENGSDPAGMRDLVRGSIVVSSPEEAAGVLAAIQEKYTLSRPPKDRFANPLPTGYSDMLINVKLPGGIDGEIQVHIPEMIAAKKVGHDVYNIERKMPDSHPAKGELVRLQSAIYSAASGANKRRRERGGGG